MFMFKPIPTLDVFVAFKDGKIILMNKDLRVMNCQCIDYNINASQKLEFCQYVHFNNYFKEFCFDASYAKNFFKLDVFLTHISPTGYLNNFCMFNGQIYLVIFDYIFVLNQQNLDLICIIPYFRLNSSLKNNQSQLFSFNNKLYVHTAASKLYLLNNNQLKPMKPRHYNTTYFQFCDKLFCLNMNQLFKVVDEDFDLIFIQQLHYSEILFNINGIIILNCTELFQGNKQIYVISLLDECIYQFKVEDVKFDFFLGQRGVQVTFNKEEMNKIQKRSLDYIIEYENNTEQLNTRQFSSMLFNSKLELLVDRFNLINRKLVENQRKSAFEQNNIQSGITKVNEQLNLMVAKFVEYTLMQEQQ
ncbi:Hypothetical_protein [Hexamita inflata]|uniref:Hypothetical_protein n=1 Tax=Hexamita inflata TaxID=28002 RepID=A0AA86Q5U3_9EUKA|nr:Hypothetical protein HINF_LOCUS40341 [Hexamita inflata]